MKENITIKKFPSGIKLHLKEEIAFEDLLSELAAKFYQSRQFFKDAKVALALEGRKLTEEEERQVVNVIHSNSDLKIICLIGKQEDSDYDFESAIKRIEMQNEEIFHFYKGNLEPEQILEEKYGIVILGDVCSGAAVTSRKNIIIMGKLYGEAHAGLDGEDGHYIVALEMSPDKIRIGDFRYKHKEKKRLGFKTKTQPKIAYVKDKHIAIETITKELPANFPVL